MHRDFHAEPWRAVFIKEVKAGVIFSRYVASDSRGLCSF